MCACHAAPTSLDADIALLAPRRPPLVPQLPVLLAAVGAEPQWPPESGTASDCKNQTSQPPINMRSLSQLVEHATRSCGWHRAGKGVGNGPKSAQSDVEVAAPDQQQRVVKLGAARPAEHPALVLLKRHLVCFDGDAQRLCGWARGLGAAVVVCARKREEIRRKFGFWVSNCFGDGEVGQETQVLRWCAVVA